MNQDRVSGYQDALTVPHGPGTGLTRRDLLRYSAAAAVLGGGALLAACSSGSGGSSSSGSGGPKRGGELRVALTGGSADEKIDPWNPFNLGYIARSLQIFEPLVHYDARGRVEYVLAEELSSNADATVWTIRLRSGVTFHDGRKFSADDVIYNFQTMVREKTPTAAPLFASADIANLRRVDDLTLQIPFKAPNAIFETVLADYARGTQMAPKGWDRNSYVGTGPFTFKSFTPGSESIFLRNPNYWMPNRPYVDTLVITDYQSPTSQRNAILSGQADAANNLTSPDDPQVERQAQLSITTNNPSMYPFVMQATTPPFNDVRVRQAMRLLCDRAEMAAHLYGGKATIGNDDFMPPFSDVYNKSLSQREVDIDQAKSLLAAAGQEKLTVELVTRPQAVLPQAAQILQSQAKKAGVTINLRNVTVADFYAKYGKWAFTQDQWPGYHSYVAMVQFTSLPTSPYNVTGYDDPQFTSLYHQLTAQPDASKRQELINEMQKIQWDSGTYLIPFWGPMVDAYSKRVRGFTPGVANYLNEFNFKDLWLT